MFSLLNSVQVIPVICVDFLRQTLARADIHAPVLLKAHRDRMGWLTLCGWVLGHQDPVRRDIPTEMIICPSEREKLKGVLEGFCAEIQARERSEGMAFPAELIVGIGAG